MLRDELPPVDEAVGLALGELLRLFVAALLERLVVDALLVVLVGRELLGEVERDARRRLCRDRTRRTLAPPRQNLKRIGDATPLRSARAQWPSSRCVPCPVPTQLK